jgi:hypothetical protein
VLVLFDGEDCEGAKGARDGLSAEGVGVGGWPVRAAVVVGDCRAVVVVVRYGFVRSSAE